MRQSGRVRKSSSLRAWLFIAVVTPTISFAQLGGAEDKSIAAAYTEVAPVLDGVLDDWAWLTATIVEDLHVVTPNEGDEPSERSRFFITYGDNALYVAAEFFDSSPDEIVANVLRQGDYSEGDDGVMLILDPFNQGRSGYGFYLMVNAVRAQALYISATEENWNWDGIWHAATKRTDEGWNAEIEIPFSTLSFDPRNDTWGINFSRFIGRRAEEIGWVSHNRKQNPASAGKIAGLRGMKQGLGLDVTPSAVLSESRNYALGTSESEAVPSLDVTYKPTPALTAALTLNTDFSGTSADLRQVNLTRFSLFFPEKRKFFLQDTDIFEFGRIGGNDDNGGGSSRVSRESARPFFSRRIGLSGDGEVIDIEGGLKVTGRADGWDYGILGVRQDSFGGVDAKDLFVGRLAANVLEESSAGIIATYGDPGSNEDNSLFGADFRYLNTRLANGKTLQGSAWYQQTDTPGLEGDDAAYGFSMAAPNSEGFSGSITYKEMQKNYKPALGFVDLVDVRNLLFEGAYTWRPDTGPFRTIKTGVEGKRTETIAGNLDNEEIVLQPIRLENHQSDFVTARYSMNKEQLTMPFEISDGVIIPAGLYDWNRYCLIVGTGSQRDLKFFTWACSGEFYDGTRQSYGPEFTWRPSKHLSLTASYTVDFVDLPYGSFTTRQAILQADIALTSTWYWENLIQYDNVSDSLGINSIMRWVPLAGRELVFVLNREMLDPTENLHFESSFSEMVVKFYYTFRF
jgi:hypothetical protein